LKTESPPVVKRRRQLYIFGESLKNTESNISMHGSGSSRPNLPRIGLSQMPIQDIEFLQSNMSFMPFLILGLDPTAHTGDRGIIDLAEVAKYSSRSL